MRRTVSLLIGTLLAATAVTQAAAGSRPDPEARLTRALEGRVAGEPRDCLIQRDIRSSRIFDRTAILYETSDGKYYLNRPRSGRESLDTWDVLVTDTHTPWLCSIDIVRLYDTGLRAQTGSVFLGPFVPYTKPRRAR